MCRAGVLQDRSGKHWPRGLVLISKTGNFKLELII